MTEQASYRSSVCDRYHQKEYSRYQKKYAQKMRESDKILIQLVRETVENRLSNGAQPRLLDIGCSTGNFLRHLKHVLPDVELTGGDIISPVIKECKRNPDLKGIRFEKMEMLHLRTRKPYDLVVANAALMFFHEEEFRRALSSIGRVIKKKGWFIAFDFFHPFEQQITIVEKTRLHPQGLRFYFRGYSRMREDLKKAGFSAPRFTPFRIPIDLPKPLRPADITTHTISSSEGQRMSFRGTLFQPWCYLQAQKEKS